MFKIFVGNLDYKVRPEQVRELFSIYAPIEDLVIPTDPKTNKPRGFAIVMIRDPELGAAAVKGVHGKRLMGRELVVNEAIKKKGKASAPTTTPPRSGPFGPRMFRTGDARVRGSRNPRRSSASGAPNGPSVAPGQVARPATPPVAPPSPSVPPGAARGAIPARVNPTPPPPEADGRALAGAPRSTAAKARPKASPASPLNTPPGAP